MTTQQITAPPVPAGLGTALLEKIEAGAVSRNGHVKALLTRRDLQETALLLVNESWTAYAPYDAADLYDVEQWADSVFVAVPDGEEAVLLLPFGNGS